MVPHIGTPTTSHVILMSQLQLRRITGQPPKETGAKHNHPSIHHMTMRLMRKAGTNAMRGITTLIHSHTARTIPPTDIQGRAHAQQTRIILLLIGLHTTISAAMATERTPTRHVTDVQTSAIGHKIPIEDVIARNQANKKASVTVLMRIVPTQQTA